MFLIVAFIVAGIVILMAVGVFSYGLFLRHEADAKAAQLQAEQAKVSQDTVQGFIRLKNRLGSAEDILNQHVMLSQFFDVLERTTLASVRFSSLGITLNPDHSADIKMTGLARDFNSLAAQSAAFATEPRIKQAIFSGINADKTGVSFSVVAKLDPKLVVIGSAAAAVAPAVQPVSPATTTAPVASSSPVTGAPVPTPPTP
jgi:hypothetical protein